MHIPTQLDTTELTLDNVLELELYQLVKLSRDTKALAQIITNSGLDIMELQEIQQIIKLETKTLLRNLRREASKARINQAYNFAELMRGIYDANTIIEPSETNRAKPILVLD